jgi:predicted glycosyltransferase involved in capsule biosynthesis
MEDKTDFNDISLIVPIRIDTESRGDNLFITHNFYKKYCKNIRFVFVENDHEIKSMFKSSFLYPNINEIYCFIGNDKDFNKCITYNIGAKLSTTKYLCLIDLDVIIHPQQIIKAKNKIIENKMDLMIAYNGLAFYLSEQSKSNFEKEYNYECLRSNIPENRSVNYKNENLLIGNNQAVGGCLVVERSTFFKFKGFNPNFIGWGYEDNEIISRVQRLGYNVGRINGKEDVLWHLPHESKSSKPKEQHNYYEKNHQICSMVESITKEQLEEYIKTWEV